MERDILAKIIDKVKSIRTALGVLKTEVESGFKMKTKQLEATTSTVNVYSEGITPAKFVSAIVTGGGDSNSVFALPYTYNNNLILRLCEKNADNQIVAAQDATRTVIVQYYE